MQAVAGELLLRLNHECTIKTHTESSSDGKGDSDTFFVADPLHQLSDLAAGSLLHLNARAGRRVALRVLHVATGPGPGGPRSTQTNLRCQVCAGGGSSCPSAPACARRLLAAALIARSVCVHAKTTRQLQQAYCRLTRHGAARRS